MSDNRRDVIASALLTLGLVEGANDVDAACLRVARRKLAEVLGRPLGEYRLLGEEGPVEPLYVREPSDE